MNHQIQACPHRKAERFVCSSASACKGWGCHFITTPIAKIPTTDQEKEKLFVQVYREAKQKGVLECPHYRSSIIDEVLDGFSS